MLPPHRLPSPIPSSCYLYVSLDLLRLENWTGGLDPVVQTFSEQRKVLACYDSDVRGRYGLLWARAGASPTALVKVFESVIGEIVQTVAMPAVTYSLPLLCGLYYSSSSPWDAGGNVGHCVLPGVANGDE
jgi:hypothetical protein